MSIIRKICIVVTTRGNYAKMKSVIQHIQDSPDLELQLIAAGGAILPKYGNIVDAIDSMGVRVDRHIHYIVEGENPVTMAKSAGLAVSDFSTAFEDLAPDVVVVIADRYECLPIAMAAAYMNIVVAHVEGGEVSGSIDESIRHAITKMAHIHFPSTEEAAERIKRMGEDPYSVFQIGGTSLDVINALDLDDIEPVMEFQQRAGVGRLVDLNEPFLVVIQHPVTTEYAMNRRHVDETLYAINGLRMNTIWIWPNMDAGSDGVSKGIRVYRERNNPSFVHFIKALPIELYAPLLKNASCIVGNSSSGIREAAFLGTPSVNVGSRQAGRDRCANVLDVGYDRDEITSAIHKQMEHGRYTPDYRYGDGEAGRRMVEILRKVDLKIQKQITY